MAEVLSTFRLKPGDAGPSFELPDWQGDPHTLDGVRGERGTLVVFACNHCPFVIHLAPDLGVLAEALAGKGIKTVAIMPNDVANYPADAPDKMGPFAEESGWKFPYLYDESQEVAKAWGAACTPDFFLLDEDGRLFYAGQFDSSRPKNGQSPTGNDLRAAAEALLGGETPPSDPYPSSGCNIKWKPGSEPPWFG